MEHNKLFHKPISQTLKILLFVMVGMLNCNIIHSTSSQYAILWMRNGEKIAYKLEDHPIVKHNADSLKVITNYMEVDYPLDNLWMFTLSDTDDGFSALVEGPSFHERNTLNIYNIEGKLIRSFLCPSKAEIAVSTIGLLKGIYIIKFNNESHKIIIK